MPKDDVVRSLSGSPVPLSSSQSQPHFSLAPPHYTVNGTPTIHSPTLVKLVGKLTLSLPTTRPLFSIATIHRLTQTSLLYPLGRSTIDTVY